jgi:hypothetical protein
LSGYEDQLAELLTMRFAGDQGVQLYELMLELATAQEHFQRRTTAAVVRALLGEPDARRDPLFENYLQRMGGPAGLIALEMIRGDQKPAQRRRLVNMVRRWSKVKSPHPMRVWIEAGDAQLEELKAEWESLIDPNGSMHRALQETLPCTAPAQEAG